jgi:hypothetical protein
VGCGATSGSLLFYVAYCCHDVLDTTHTYSRSEVVGFSKYQLLNYFMNDAVGRGIVVCRGLVSCCGSMFCVRWLCGR